MLTHCDRRSATHSRLRGMILTGIVWSLLGGSGEQELAGQDRAAPGGFQVTAVAIKGARIVVRPGEEIAAGNLVIRDGRITAVGAEAAIPIDAEVIEGEGLVVYAGFLDAGSDALLDPRRPAVPEAGESPDFRRDALVATRADNRRGMTPEFQAQSALRSERETLDNYRQAGFTCVHVIPTQAIAAGQGCCLSLSGAPRRGALLRSSTFSVFRLEPPPTNSSSSTLQYPVTLMGAFAHLRQAFLDADRHARQVALYERLPNAVEAPTEDPALTALQEVRRGDRPALFLADSRDDIDRAFAFSDEHGLAPAVLGGRDARDCLARIQEGPADVILELAYGDEPKIESDEASDELQAEQKPPRRFQESEHERWLRRVGTAAELQSGGVRFAFSTRGAKSPAAALNEARTLVEQGLDADAALAALTENAAGILGVEDRLGALEPGKLGHVVVMTGRWQDRESKVRFAVIDGQTFEYNKEAKPADGGESSGEPADLAGRWIVSIESGDMQTTRGVLELAQNKANLTGTFTSDQGSGRIRSGKVDGSSATFQVAIGAGDRSLELSFEGTIAEEDEKQTLAGTLKSAFGAPTGWSATRDVNEEPDSGNPVQLSLDSEEGAGSEAETEAAGDELPTELESDRTRRAVDTGGSVLIQNATVLTGVGETLEETDILIRDGRIESIGSDLEVEEGLTTFDVTGWYVIPGMIDTHSHIMISRGINEYSQSVVPEVRVEDVVRSDDVSEYRACAGGVTTARLLHGSSNVIGGQDAVVKLRHGTAAADHLLVDNPQGVKFALGENVKRREDRFPNTRMGVEATLKRAFFEALDYRRQWQEYERADDMEDRLPPRRDLRLEALQGILEHEVLVHCHCYRADEILMLLRTADELGFRVQSLQHVLEGYKIAPEIVAHGASCSTFADWWAYKVEAYDATPYNTTLLQRAGANVVVKSDNEELIRHMNLEAAKSLRYGNMPADDALRMVTINAARELGVDDRIGSIEVGKDGDLAVFNGHPFNPFTRCEMTIIEGDVVFKRDEQPTAMTEAQQERSATPPPLVLAGTEVRERRLELPRAGDGTYVIRGATVHPVDAADIEHGLVLISEGKIAGVGGEIEVPDGVTVIEAPGMHVYPGLIDAGTTLGITEISQVGETHDYNESGVFQPDIRAGIAINVDSELIPVSRAGGITTAFIRPNGTTIAGQYSLVQTAGWTAEEMVLEYDAGLSLDWPRNDERVEELREFLKDARLYDRIRSAPEDERPPIIIDPRYEAMRPYVTGEKRVFVEADSRKAIAEALLFAEEENLRIVITGGTDSWKLADELKSREVPVIVGATMRSPIESWDPFDATYANAGRLYESGVLFCIRSDNASNSRNAPFEAAIAVAYGLPEAEALKSVTLNAARVLGIDEQLGSITVGKTANLIITDGSPLQQTTQIKGVFVGGEPYAPESRQTRFYERYLQRLREEPAG